VPFLIRWPGKIAAGRESNEIVHGVDMFATLAKVGGAKLPDDRPMDSLDSPTSFSARPRSLRAKVSRSFWQTDYRQ
jgi:arylsulfatase A-like enzyme